MKNHLNFDWKSLLLFPKQIFGDLFLYFLIFFTYFLGAYFAEPM